MQAQEVLELIKSRRSVRKYKPEPVPEDKLQMILEAAQWGPSGENAQPWRFVVVRDQKKREILAQIAGGGSGRRFKAEYISGEMEKRLSKFKSEETRKRVYRRLISGEISAFLVNAPVVVVGCSRLNAWDPPYDVSAATQNMLIMTHALGLGACWLAAPIADVRDELKVKKLLNVPKDYAIFNVVAIGIPDETPKVRPRLPLEEIAFFDEYGKPR